MFQVGLPCYLGLNSGRSVSINVDKTRKHFPQKFITSWCAHVSPMFAVSHSGNIVSSVSFVFKMQIMLALLSREIKRKSEHVSTCKIFASTSPEASTHLIFSSSSSKGQILRALSNWTGPFDTPKRDVASKYVTSVQFQTNCTPNRNKLDLLSL